MHHIIVVGGLGSDSDHILPGAGIFAQMEYQETAEEIEGHESFARLLRLTLSTTESRQFGRLEDQSSVLVFCSEREGESKPEYLQSIQYRLT